MKKAASILLLAIYLLGTTQACELLKLPQLWKHYTAHHQWNPQLSFAGFLIEHYATDDGIDGDQAEDMQLPFKTTTDCCHSQIATFHPLTATCKLVKTAYVIEQVRRPLDGPALYASLFLSNIWQPPRSC